MNELASSSSDGATAALLKPTDLRSLRDAVLDTRGAIAIAGAGTAAAWAGALGPVDAVLETTGLTGVIVHNPGDMTVAVRAGTPLLALAQELAPHGQHVGFDAARVEDGATVGGLLATADAGPGALARGSLRDLVIGVTLVLADGTVARSGGHVIKNVAGYDLAKLVHGSYGTLAVVAEVVLRLHPVPERSATLVVEASLDEAVAITRAVLGGPFEPTALEWLDGELLIRTEGRASAMDARLAALRNAVHEVHTRPTRLDEEIWARHAAATRGDGAVVRVGVRPSLLPGVLGALSTRSVAAGLGTGVATIGVAPQNVPSVHAAVHAAGGTSVLRARPAGSDAPAWGPPPSALSVLKAIKNELDPLGRFGPGRFDPWM